jgi:hypothetical protein
MSNRFSAAEARARAGKPTVPQVKLQSIPYTDMQLQTLLLIDRYMSECDTAMQIMHKSPYQNAVWPVMKASTNHPDPQPFPHHRHCLYCRQIVPPRRLFVQSILPHSPESPRRRRLRCPTYSRCGPRCDPSPVRYSLGSARLRRPDVLFVSIYR